MLLKLTEITFKFSEAENKDREAATEFKRQESIQHKFDLDDIILVVELEAKSPRLSCCHPARDYD